MPEFETASALKLQQGDPVEIRIGDKRIGRDTFTVIAGPCTIENYPDLLRIAGNLHEMGISFLRGGAYKLRTSPYDFRGLGKKGLEYMRKVCRETGMKSVSEVISVEDIEIISDYVDILQIGTRNMQNYRLLERMGNVSNPVILKRGMSNRIEEWLFAAEHILASGNPNVILCERGIRSFENLTRNTLDISAVPLAKKMSNLPVIVDPSHSSGRRDLIRPLILAAAGAGADGVILETHFAPAKAVCDGKQTIDQNELRDLLEPIRRILPVWGKSLN